MSNYPVSVFKQQLGLVTEQHNELINQFRKLLVKIKDDLFASTDVNFLNELQDEVATFGSMLITVASIVGITQAQSAAQTPGVPTTEPSRPLSPLVYGVILVSLGVLAAFAYISLMRTELLFFAVAIAILGVTGEPIIKEIARHLPKIGEAATKPEGFAASASKKVNDLIYWYASAVNLVPHLRLSPEEQASLPPDNPFLEKGFESFAQMRLRTIFRATLQELMAEVNAAAWTYRDRLNAYIVEVSRPVVRRKEEGTQPLPAPTPRAR